LGGQTLIEDKEQERKERKSDMIDIQHGGDLKRMEVKAAENKIK
jgi:hypothetical protein